jgi:hypothetical protein
MYSCIYFERSALSVVWESERLIKDRIINTRTFCMPEYILFHGTYFSAPKRVRKQFGGQQSMKTDIPQWTNGIDTNVSGNEKNM